MRKKFSISKHIVFICVILVSFCGMYFNKDLPWFFTSQNQRGYACFFIGVLLYDYFVKRLSDYMKKTILVVLFILSVVGVWYRGINSWVVLSIFVYPAILCLLVYIKQLPDKYAILGTTSYEVYLWHLPCFMLLQVIGRTLGIFIPHSYVTMILFVVFVEVIAIIVYKYYEVPVTKWLKGKFDGN